jgi:hypothetical protein
MQDACRRRAPAIDETVIAARLPPVHVLAAGSLRRLESPT